MMKPQKRLFELTWTRRCSFSKTLKGLGTVLMFLESYVWVSDYFDVSWPTVLIETGGPGNFVNGLILALSFAATTGSHISLHLEATRTYRASCQSWALHEKLHPDVLHCGEQHIVHRLHSEQDTIRKRGMDVIGGDCRMVHLGSQMLVSGWSFRNCGGNELLCRSGVGETWRDRKDGNVRIVFCSQKHGNEDHQADVRAMWQTGPLHLLDVTSLCGVGQERYSTESAECEQCPGRKDTKYKEIDSPEWRMICSWGQRACWWRFHQFTHKNKLKVIEEWQKDGSILNADDICDIVSFRCVLMWLCAKEEMMTLDHPNLAVLSNSTLFECSAHFGLKSNKPVIPWDKTNHLYKKSSLETMESRG